MHSPAADASLTVCPATLCLQRSAKLREEWEQRVASGGAGGEGGRRGRDDGRSSRRRDAEDAGVEDAGGSGRYARSSGRGGRGGDAGGGREEEEDERGYRQRPSSQPVRRAGAEGGRLAGRLQMPEGLYFQGEEAPERCVRS